MIKLPYDEVELQTFFGADSPNLIAGKERAAQVKEREGKRRG
jgi:hypothetical protein